MWEPRPLSMLFVLCQFAVSNELFLNDGKTLLGCMTEYGFFKPCHRKQRCSTRKGTRLTFPSFTTSPKERCSDITTVRTSSRWTMASWLVLSLVERIPLTNPVESGRVLKESVVFLLKKMPCTQWIM